MISDAAVDVAPESQADAGPRRVHTKYGHLFEPPGQRAGTDAGARALIVYMHGMGASPEDSCRYFEPAAIANDAILVCPKGNARASEGGAWIGNLDDKRYSLDQMMKDRPSGATLMGFSIGARFAMQLARAEPGKWTSLILMNQIMEVRRADLEKAGVRRVVLCAGDFDASYAPLYAEKQALAKSGFPVRFVSLGPVGHRFSKDMEALMVDAITWARSSSPD